MLVLVDTNVFLWAMETSHAQHGQAIDTLRALRQAGHTLSLVPQAHYEFWVVATRPAAQNGLGMTTVEAEAQLRRLGPPLFRLLRNERAIYDAWRELVATHQVQGRQVHDARLVAAMQRHNIQHLLTFNPGDFQRFPGIIVLKPA